MRTATLTALVVAALMLAGCGGGNGDGDRNGGPDNGGPDNGAASGEAVFAEAGCGGCHVLAAAGSSGTVGPALDGANLSFDTVEEQVRNGGGGMPAFEDQLSDDEIEAVAEFVSEASQG